MRASLLLVLSSTVLVTGCFQVKLTPLNRSSASVGSSPISITDSVALSSPVAGDKVYSSVRVTARSSLSATQIGSMRVLVDGAIVYQVPAQSVDRYVPISTRGNVIVQVQSLNLEGVVVGTTTASVTSPADTCADALPNAGNQLFPAKLSQACLYSDITKYQVSDILRPFEPQYPLWADGAVKHRWIYLPYGMKIDTADMDGWNFPVGTRIFKEFVRDGKRVETRVLVKITAARGKASWLAGTYQWAVNQADADYIAAGAIAVNGTDHDIPAVATCTNCHGGGKDFALGFDALQQTVPYMKGWINMDVLKGESLLTTNPVGDVQIIGTLKAKMAIGYMHANCSHCHNPLGLAAGVGMNLRHNLDAVSTITENAYVTTVLAGTPRIIAGSPATSRVIIRMSARPGMPPIATKVVDQNGGLLAVTDWINELGAK